MRLRMISSCLLPVATCVTAACSKAPAREQPKAPVGVARVETRAVPFLIAATGTVEPLQTVEVIAQVGGLLQKVHFNEGDEVRQGQVLFEIDPRPFQAAL